MKKVININFQGQVIAIEETAYEILKQYINSLKSYFSREDGGEEIVNDIENRIAELFGNQLKLGISCITDEDVESIISSIGKPEDFDTDYAEATFKDSEMPPNIPHTDDRATEQTENTQKEPARALYRNANDRIIAGVCSGLAHYFKIDPVWIRIIFVLAATALFWIYIILWIVLRSRPLESNISKRLYRNPSDKYIGGVCGGIAAYFKIDSWIPRLVFLLPLLLFAISGLATIPFFFWNNFFDSIHFNWNFNLAMLIVYFVLWIIIPQAVTVKQKLEMMGEEEYIKSLRNTMSDNIANVRNKSDNIHSDASNRMPPPPPHTSHETYSQRSGCMNAFIILLKIAFFTIAGLFALSVIGMLIAILAAGTFLIPLKGLFIAQGTETTLMWITLFLTIGLPVIAIILWIIRRMMKAKPRRIIGVVTLTLWFVGIATGIALGVKVVNKFRMEALTEKTVALKSVPGNTLYINMQPYPDSYYTTKTSVYDRFENPGLPFYNVNEDSLLFNKISINVMESSDSLFHIKTVFVSKGKNLKSIKNEQKTFCYDIIQRDSLILFPEFFATPASIGFRDQHMNIEVAVPAGKKVVFDGDLAEYQHNKPYYIKNHDRKYRNRNVTREYDINHKKSSKKKEVHV